MATLISQVSAFSHITGASEGVFLHLLILICLQLKIIVLPKGHIMGFVFPSPLGCSFRGYLLMWVCRGPPTPIPRSVVCS